MAKKDFLEQFSTNNKPDSFKEEVRIPTTKPKFVINKGLIIALAVSFLVIVTGIWYFVFRPTIEMPSFIGEEVSDINSWLKQQGIDSTGIIYKEEYSEDVEKKLIISQSIEEGKKIKNDAKIDFVVSLGPDPNTEITVPDIASMNLTRIKEWISTNKLTSVKLNYEFSDEDPLDSVIAFEFGNNVSETNFKRSSSLTITFSKGKQEDQPISVPNFVGKNISDATTWGSKNKIKIKQVESYSGTVLKDLVISQSVNPGKKITMKETLTVTISKGDPIYAPDFSSYSKESIDAWKAKNNVIVEYEERYSSEVEEGKVISQEPSSNKPCNEGIVVTISLGNISERVFDKSGHPRTKQGLDDWIKEVNKKGADLKMGHFPGEHSDSVPLNEIFGLSDISVGKTINGYISNGKYIYLADLENSGAVSDDFKYWPTSGNCTNYKESDMRNLCTNSGKELTCYFEYVKNDTGSISKVNSISYKNNEFPEKESYILQSDAITIKINLNDHTPTPTPTPTP